VINRDEILKFGLRLKAIRKERLFSQQHLADISNLSKITIQRIEQGKFSVTLDTLISISKALEIKINDLVNLD
jgi:transcriptional regulator with XRE-family HTH domain